MAELDDHYKEIVNNELRHVDTFALLDLLTEYIVTELSHRDEDAAELT